MPNTETQGSLQRLDDLPPASYQIRRLRHEGGVFVSVEDILYLTEASRDRHSVMGHGRAAETMDNFAAVLSTVLLVE
jgi:hypothetical protein